MNRANMLSNIRNDLTEYLSGASLADAVASVDVVPTYTLLNAVAERPDLVDSWDPNCDDNKLMSKLLSSMPSEAMLEILARRGGHPGALAEAAILCARKSQDYNAGKGADIHNVDRSNYFPLGLASYAQMIHTKSERLLSLVRKGQEQAVFESARDTLLDLINYAGFGADHLNKEGKR